MNPTTISMILKLLDLVSLGLTLAPQIKSSYEAHRDLIQKMVDEGREPTQEEYDNLLLDIQKNTDELNSNA